MQESAEVNSTIPGKEYDPCLLNMSEKWNIPSSSFTVGPVGFPTVGTAAYRLIVPPCAQMTRETSDRERENYGREMA
jgi:hypothetical protein